jgi:capsular exopolysaccharide synthesis family protein
MLDSRLRSADEISVALGIPVLGVVPTMSDRKAMALPGHKVRVLLSRIFAGGYQRAQTSALSESGASEFVHTQDDAKSPAETASFLEYALRVRCELENTRRIQHASKKPAGAVCATVPRREVETKPKAVIVGSPIAETDKGAPGKPQAVRRGQKVRLEPSSLVAEAYRTIRTAVFFGVSQDEAKTILITSPTPGDGKSTVASNLAITMAQAGQKTLVLDADLRKPTQHDIFEIGGRGEGLSNLLAGAIDMEEAIRPGPSKNLDILTSGVEIPNPAEVLNSAAFVRVLREFSQRYDRVIIDSPPVGPVADGQILSALCDVTLLVLRAEISTRRHSRQARDSLLSVGGRILGAVVNDVQRGYGRYGYYSGYARYGAYGYYGKTAKKEKVAV